MGKEGLLAATEKHLNKEGADIKLWTTRNVLRN